MLRIINISILHYVLTYYLSDHVNLVMENYINALTPPPELRKIGFHLKGAHFDETSNCIKKYFFLDFFYTELNY